MSHKHINMKLRKQMFICMMEYSQMNSEKRDRYHFIIFLQHLVELNKDLLFLWLIILI